MVLGKKITNPENKTIVVLVQQIKSQCRISYSLDDVMLPFNN
jgi:hypothetical protein